MLALCTQGLLMLPLLNSHLIQQQPWMGAALQHGPITNLSHSTHLIMHASRIDKDYYVSSIFMSYLQ